MPLPYVFVQDTGGNEGVERALTVAEFDGNTLITKNALEALQSTTGRQLATPGVTSSGTALTFHYTDLTTDGPFPFPAVDIGDAGTWTNNTAYSRNYIVTAPGFGIYLILEDHVTPVSPAVFDPEATDESTDENPLYRLISPEASRNYDFAFNIFGELPEGAVTDGVMIGKYAVVRNVGLAADLPLSRAHLETPAEGTDGVQIDIEKNGTAIGSISFATGENDGEFTFEAAVTFTNGDRLALRLLTSDGGAADLSVTLAGELQLA